MNVAKPAQLAKAAKKSGIPLTFEKGQILFYQGHQPFGLFWIEDGRVELSSQTETGRKAVTNMEGSGKLVGLDDLLAQRSYSATATCISKSRVFFLSRNQIQDIAPKEVAKRSASL